MKRLLYLLFVRLMGNWWYHELIKDSEEIPAECEPDDGWSPPVTKEELKAVKDELDKLQERIAAIDGVGIPWCYRRCRPDDHFGSGNTYYNMGDDGKWHPDLQGGLRTTSGG